MKSHEFAGLTVEAGANWVQGTQVGNGPANPIYELKKKHNVKTVVTDYFAAISEFNVDYGFLFSLIHANQVPSTPLDP